MSKEQDIIKMVLQILPHSRNHVNDYFESDAEIISINQQKFLFSLDEFSIEDFFRDHDAYSLGWNVTACTLSDIFASGGTPVYFAHSMSINTNKWDTEYIENFSKGIRDVLNGVNCTFIGGDTGFSENWHYTGVALGKTDTPMLRKGAKEQDLIYITGSVGIGNLEAALKLYSDNTFIGSLAQKLKLRFPVRFRESQVIKKFATSCIDTSDGLLHAINTIADINTVGYSLSNIPFNKKGIMACKLLKKPEAMLLLGECGEYELLFTIPPSANQQFLNEVNKHSLYVTPIGEIVQSSRTINNYGKTIDLSDFKIQARDFDHIKNYLNSLLTYAKNFI